MEMTRREFLGVTAAAALPLPLLPPPTPRPRWLVMPVPGECSIEESTRGYQGALSREPAGRTGSGLVIIPAVLDIPPHADRVVRTFLRVGMTVIIESGAGFAGHLHFRRHRRALRERLDIDVHAPVDLWTDQPTRPRIPYVQYHWPYHTKVRDFSRVLPLGDQSGEIIAWAGNLAVAVKRRVGKGTLIYLGSPLGPALWAGDTEARQWLSRLYSL